MKRTILAAALAAVFAAPVYAAGIPQGVDETDLSWQYLPPTAKPQFDDATADTPAKAPVRTSDETDTSWIYAPNGKPFFDAPGANSSAQPYVENVDENDLTWLYQPASAGRFADPRREHPYVAFGTTENPLKSLLGRIGRNAPSGS